MNIGDEATISKNVGIIDSDAHSICGNSDFAPITGKYIWIGIGAIILRVSYRCLRCYYCRKCNRT